QSEENKLKDDLEKTEMLNLEGECHAPVGLGLENDGCLMVCQQISEIGSSQTRIRLLTESGNLIESKTRGQISSSNNEESTVAGLQKDKDDTKAHEQNNNRVVDKKEATLELHTISDLNARKLEAGLFCNTPMPSVNGKGSFQYNSSVTGSILSVTANKNQVFYDLEHGNFKEFRATMDHDHTQVVRMRNDRNQTLLHVGVIRDISYVWIRLLLLRNVDPCAQDNDGYTAAHYAVERDDVEMLKALTVRFHLTIKIFSDIEITKIQNRCLEALGIQEFSSELNVFMLACKQQAVNCIKYLHELEIDNFNTKDKYGDTALHYVVSRNNALLTNFLIHEYKMDTNGGDIDRPSVLDIACYNQNLTIQQKLLDHNARSRCLIETQTQPNENITEKENISVPSTIISRLLLQTDGGQEEVTSDVDGNSTSSEQVSNFLEKAGQLVKEENIHDAIKYYEDILNLLIPNPGGIHNSDIAKTYNNLGTVHHRKGNFTLALKNYSKSLQMNLSLNNQSEAARCYANIGLIHAIQNNYTNALEHFQNALDATRLIPVQNKDEIARIEKYIGMLKIQ
ncbi:unnamed protein product, partial [Didymodactylos carnosus]